jgi:hypothetical protein
MAGTLGFMLQPFFDSIVEFQNEDHHHPSFKQGRLLLKEQWIIPPEGQSARSFPLLRVRGWSSM